MRSSLILGVWLVAAACYTFTPVPMATAPLAQDARVLLSDSGATAVASLIGPRAEYVEGAILAADRDGVQVRATVVHRMNGQDEKYEEPFAVRIPATAISQVQIKKVQAGKSVLLAGAIVVGTALVAKGASSSDSRGNGSSQPNNGK